MAFSSGIVENANVLIAVLDPKGNVQVWNKAAEIITGYSPDEVIGRRDIWKRLYPDDDYRRTVTNRISTIISEQKYFENLETTIQTKSGANGLFRGIPGRLAQRQIITRSRSGETLPSSGKPRNPLWHI